jgi:hypothetical protein
MPLYHSHIENEIEKTPPLPLPHSGLRNKKMTASNFTIKVIHVYMTYKD